MEGCQRREEKRDGYKNNVGWVKDKKQDYCDLHKEERKAYGKAKRLAKKLAKQIEPSKLPQLNQNTDGLIGLSTIIPTTLSNVENPECLCHLVVINSNTSE